MAAAKVFKGVVWKFALPSRGHERLMMPADAQLLSVQAQGDTVTLWALVDPDAQRHIGREFYVAMTGEALRFVNCDGTFVGTVQLHGGRYVAHVFEVRR